MEVVNQRLVDRNLRVEAAVRDSVLFVVCWQEPTVGESNGPTLRGLRNQATGPVVDCLKTLSGVSGARG